MKYKLIINNLALINTQLKISITGEFANDNIKCEDLSTPKVVLHFENGIEDRRIPVPIKRENIKFVNGKCVFSGEYEYSLDFIFWKTRKDQKSFNIYFNLWFKDFYKEKVEFILKTKDFEEDKNYYMLKVCNNYFFITKIFSSPKRKLKIFQTTKNLKNDIKTIFKNSFNKDIVKKIYKKYLIKIVYKTNYDKEIDVNKITFYSTRRDDISGNFQFVYDKIKNNENLNINFLFQTKPYKDLTYKEIKKFVNACVTSKVIVLDEFTPQIHCINLKPETKLIQLWHACGAFKTFGFSRISKPKGSVQTTSNHRSYDYVTVSSKYCQKCHSEGFGISTSNVVPTGIARTDIFFDEEYKTKFRNRFYNEYPNLKNKKVILFAPTFRGDIKEEAYYPMELFDVKRVLDYLGDRYAIIIKHHPFIKEKHNVPEEYKDRVIDLSENIEINDLLFVSDLIITDYSSLVFEGAILNKPMYFYAYDLKEYIELRDFYFDFQHYIPGRICMELEALLKEIKKENYNYDKLNQFREMFFDDLDGQSSQRIADLLYKALKE